MELEGAAHLEADAPGETGGQRVPGPGDRLIAGIDREDGTGSRAEGEPAIAATDLENTSTVEVREGPKSRCLGALGIQSRGSGISPVAVGRPSLGSSPYAQRCIAVKGRWEPWNSGGSSGAGSLRGLRSSVAPRLTLAAPPCFARALRALGRPGGKLKRIRRVRGAGCGAPLRAACEVAHLTFELTRALPRDRTEGARGCPAPCSPYANATDSVLQHPVTQSAGDR